MDITSELKNEHQNILQVIDLVLEECNQLEMGKNINNDFFTKVVGFIKNYADGYHHAKEEKILFLAMLDNSECMHCNPIPVMLNDHDAGRNYVVGMVKALEESDKSQLVGNSRGYCYLLQNHIAKEDQILYPMAEETVSETKKDEVLQLYNIVNQRDFFSEDVNDFIKQLRIIL